MRVIAPLLVAVLAASALAAGPEFPPLSGRVVDRADMLNSSSEQRLTNLLQTHEKEPTNQVVVVMLPDLQGYPIEEFGYLLGRTWGIGQAERDNGVLPIVAQQERQVRMEVGYAVWRGHSRTL